MYVPHLHLEAVLTQLTTYLKRKIFMKKKNSSNIEIAKKLQIKSTM